MTAWKAYGIGSGTRIELDTHGVQLPKMTTLKTSVESTSSFKTCKNDTRSDLNDGHLEIVCPEANCICLFSTLDALGDHMVLGNRIKDIRGTLEDRSKLMYSSKILKDQRSLGISREKFAKVDTSDSQPDCPKGWTLKEIKKPTRFSFKQTTYLNDKFMEGEFDKSAKADPNQVAKQIRFARGANGARLGQKKKIVILA